MQGNFQSNGNIFNSRLRPKKRRDYKQISDFRFDRSQWHINNNEVCLCRSWSTACIGSSPSRLEYSSNVFIPSANMETLPRGYVLMTVDKQQQQQEVVFVHLIFSLTREHKPQLWHFKLQTQSKATHTLHTFDNFFFFFFDNKLFQRSWNTERRKVMSKVKSSGSRPVAVALTVLCFYFSRNWKTSGGTCRGQRRRYFSLWMATLDFWRDKDNVCSVFSDRFNCLII